ncbi:DUF5131 family protein [Burkholderia cepacia]|uniref:DUF5131 family protein n=1 Tax=Burkholderia cepacia TaxID=292 RepID=UPI00398F7935
MPKRDLETRPELLAWIERWLAGGAPANVWLDATIVNQAEADPDIPKLLAVPARVRFLSMEPLLGPVTLPRFCACGCNKPLAQAVRDAMDGPSVLNRYQAEAEIRSTLGIDWVIVGGESGPGARPMYPDWPASLRDQYAAAGVPFLFKQWGEWLPAPEVIDAGGSMFHRFDDETWMQRCGKRAAGRHLDGRTHDDFPMVQSSGSRENGGSIANIENTWSVTWRM